MQNSILNLEVYDPWDNLVLLIAGSVQAVLSPDRKYSQFRFGVEIYH